MQAAVALELAQTGSNKLIGQCRPGVKRWSVLLAGHTLNLVNRSAQGVLVGWFGWLIFRQRAGPNEAGAACEARPGLEGSILEGSSPKHKLDWTLGT